MVKRVGFLLFLVVFVSLPAFCQFAAVIGRVVDSTGAVLPDVKITARNSATSAVISGPDIDNTRVLSRRRDDPSGWVGAACGGSAPRTQGAGLLLRPRAPKKGYGPFVWREAKPKGPALPCGEVDEPA